MTKPAIVVGSAPCLYDDLEKALELYPFAFVIAVNGACVALENIDAFVAGHTAKAEHFAQARRNAYPEKPVEVWANWTRKEGPPPRLTYPSVTRWFGAGVSSGATSAGKATRMALSLGYEPVIICGCPLDNSGYFEGESQKGKAIGHDCRRVGDPDQNVHRTILNYRDKFAKLAKGEFKGKVFSMSGLTRKLLGAPPG